MNLLPVTCPGHMTLGIADHRHETTCTGEVICNVILVVEHIGKVICNVVLAADLERQPSRFRGWAVLTESLRSKFETINFCSQIP